MCILITWGILLKGRYWFSKSWDGDSVYLTSSQVIAGGPQVILQVTRVWSVSDGLVSNHPPLEICCDSSWVPPWKRTQPQRHLSDALPSVPAMRLRVHPRVLSPRNSLSLNSQEYVMPSQATLELGSLKRLSLQPSSIRCVYPPCNHITRGHWEILSQVFPPRLHWEVHCRSSLCTDS